jgi:hypothetical protein
LITQPWVALGILILAQIVLERVHGKDDVEVTSAEHGSQKAEDQLGAKLFDLFGAGKADGAFVLGDFGQLAEQKPLDQRPRDKVTGLQAVNRLE